MNKREHVINGLALGLGIGYMLEPGTDVETVTSMLEFGVPITMGAMIPDIDTAIGGHRKTFHNLLTLLVFITFPYYFNNLRYIWIGITSHYVLDLLGTTRGIALFYPLRREFEIPVGVRVNSIFAPLVTVVVTVFSLVCAWFVINT